MSENFYPNNLYARFFLTNGSSELFNVNGSSTPVLFDYAPAANEVFYANALHVVLTTNGNVNSIDKFMDLSSLTNGLLYETTINGNVRPVNVQDNFELISRLDTSFDVKIIGNFTVVNGSLALTNPFPLVGANGDNVTLTVRDNLSSLSQCSINLIGSLEVF